MTVLDIIRFFIRKGDLIVVEEPHDGTGLQYYYYYYYYNIIIHVTVIETNFVPVLLSFCLSH